MRETLARAGGHFLRLREAMPALAEFLAKFSDLLMRESKGEVALDGRRLGFLHRNLLANRAVELAKAEVFGAALQDFAASARYVVQSSIPVGLNEESLQREEAVHKMEICFDLLACYFEENAEIGRANLVYELFTAPELLRRAEILLTQPLGAFVLSKAWTDLMAEDRDITLLAYTALQVEARPPRHDSAGIARLAVRQDFLAQPEHGLHRLPHGRFHRIHRRGRGAVAAVHGTRQPGGISPGIAARGRRAGHPGAHP